MKPTKELLELAKQKASATFKPNGGKQSIRLTADETSYTLFYIGGTSYIGTYAVNSLDKFFKKKFVYELRNDATGELTATMQIL